MEYDKLKRLREITDDINKSIAEAILELAATTD